MGQCQIKEGTSAKHLRHAPAIFPHIGTHETRQYLTPKWLICAPNATSMPDSPPTQSRQRTRGGTAGNPYTLGDNGWVILWSSVADFPGSGPFVMAAARPARDRRIRAGLLRRLVRIDGAAVQALRRPAVDAGGGRPDRLWRRGSRIGDARAGVSVQAGDHPHKDPGPYRDGGPDPRAGPLSGGRPPYGYRLADAGPHPNQAHAVWGRRAHRLEPDPVTAPVVSWMFAQRLGGTAPRGSAAP